MRLTQRSSVAVVTMALVMLVAAAAPFAAVGTASAEPVGSGDIVYVTDSGFEVTDASGGNLSNATVFPDANTLATSNLNVSAPGSASLTIDTRTGVQTNVSNVSGLGSLNITLTPNVSSPVVLVSGFENVSYGSIDYDVSTGGSDLTYEASASATIVVVDTELANGATVNAIDTADDSEVATGSVNDTGAVTLDIPSGTNSIDLQDPSTAPGTGSTSGGSGGSGSGAGSSSGGSSGGSGGSGGGGGGGSGGSGAGSSSGGSSGGSSSGPSILVSPAATTDDVSEGAGSGLSGSEQTSLNVSLENVNSVDPVSIDMRDASGGSGETNASTPGLRNVLPDGLDILIRHSGDYNLRVTARDIDVVAASVDTDSDTPDLSTDALNGEGKRFFQVTTQRPVGVITVDHDIKPAFVETATHKFRVRKAYLDATGGSADSVRLYRDTGETYQQLPTRLVDEDDKYHHFEAVSPGFSTFVIGTAAPVFSFEDAALDAADEATGAVEASVSVTNVGQEEGTAAVVLAADDTTLGTAEAAVSAGETVVVNADGVVEATTPVALSIADQPLGPFTRDSTTDGEPTDDSQSADGDGGGNANDQAFADPGAGSMLVIVFMTAIVGGLFLFLLWRQRGRDKDEVRRKGGEPQ
jgi:hypothetical protein